MAETIYLKDGKTEVIFDLEKTLCKIAFEYCGRDYEREIRKLFYDDSLKEKRTEGINYYFLKLQEIKEAVDDMYDLARDIKNSISDI